MILYEFSKYLQKYPEKSSVKLLLYWLEEKTSKVPSTDVEKIICTELFKFKNKKGVKIFIAKRESGRNLLKALYNFALSYEHYKFAKRTHHVHPKNFYKN